jgi:Na+/H+ antiporter NhaC
MTEHQDLSKTNHFRFALASLVFCILLPWLEAPTDRAEELTIPVVARKATSALTKALAATEAEPRQINLAYGGPLHLREEALGPLLTTPHIRVIHTKKVEQGVTIEVSISDGILDFKGTLTRTGSEDLVEVQRQRIGDSWAVVPPIIAVLIALFYRRLLIGLLLAIYFGAMLQTGFSPLEGLTKTAVDYLWGSVSGAFNLYIIAFTLSLVGMVHVMTKMGGIKGLIELVARHADSPRSTRIATTAMGGAIFFDDYANTIVVGTTMRPLTDKARISREKLAYLVDSTSAPIAGIAIISTWIGYEVGLFDEISKSLGMGLGGYDIFFSIMPLRFYCLMTLIYVLANAWTGRDWGPMLRAERRSATTGAVLGPNAKPMTQANTSHLEPNADVKARWYNAVIPIMIVVSCVIMGLFWSGYKGAGGQTIPSLFGGEAFSSTVLSEAIGSLGSWVVWREAFSNADGAKVLFFSSMAGSLTAMVLAWTQRLLTVPEAIKAWLGAIPAMWTALAILILAWSMQGVCGDLGTSIYLVGAVQDFLAPNFLPLVTFLLAAAVAFATGTSWGTMGILIPALVPLAFAMTGQVGDHIIVFLCFGAVLDGAIFGDHCSPISDTTVMSSIATSCDHVDHVKTQAPYAIATMTMAGLFGYLGVAFGLSIWLAYGLALGSSLLILFGLGKPSAVEAPSSDPTDDLEIDNAHLE